MPRQRFVPSAAHLKRVVVLGAAVFALTLSACSSDGPASELLPGGTGLSGITLPGAVDPAPVDPPAVDPAPVVLIIGGIIIVLALLASLFGRSKRRTPPLAESPQANLLSTSQWIHDQLTLELLAAPPTAALQRWATERSRLDNVAIGAQQQFSEGKDANWQPLAQTMSTLASALDTDLQLRAQDPPNAQLINESTAVVNNQRAALAQLIAVLRPTIDR